MKKTALSIIQTTMYRANIDPPTALVGETDQDTLQLIHLLYEVCEELRAAKTWTVQKRKHSFDTVASTSQYKLPKDFYSPVFETDFNQDEDDRLVGPVSDNTFNWHLHGGYSSNENYTYRIFGWDDNPNTELGQFEVNPTPSSAQTLSFDYITRHFLLPANWLPSTAYTTANYCNVNGNIYKCTSNGTSSADDPPSGTAASGIADGTAEWGYYNDPYEALIADTDLVLFDDDVVKLGLRAKWYAEKGGQWERSYREYYDLLDRAAARHKGSYRGSLSRRKRFSQRDRIPYRNWSF